ncbi:DNA primase [Candidatus Profftia tarda]|nr:DNA primase [Candidatus Profftia tarda]
MAGLIPRLFIHDLLSRTDIIDLVCTRLQLKKRGKNYYACCPFHNEKTPSFTVNSGKQFYHCFGCGAHGNAIDFLMHYDKLKFIESIEELAAIAGLDVPFEPGNKTSKTEYHHRQMVYQLMNNIKDFYQETLLTSPSSKYAHQYLVQRGLGRDIMKHFNIGYAPPGWDNILKRFGHNFSSRKDLNYAGMLVNDDKGRTYDRFRDRVIFPIRDRRGRVIAFGGRTIGNSIPKYINSPETEIFHKGRNLFGLYEAQRHNTKLSCLLVVEGYMDVVALAQFGIDYALSSLGTATTSEHIQLMFRTTDTVVCCYDGDNAGREAAWRTLKNALSFLEDGRQLRFMFLPNGEDPDTLIRKEGRSAFQKRIDQSQPLSSFLFNTLMRQVDLSSPDGRAKLSTLVLPLIRQIPGETLKLYLRQFLGQKLGIIDDSRLEKMLYRQDSKINNHTNNQIKITNMRLLIGLLIQNPSLAYEVHTVEFLWKQKLPGLELFLELVETCVANPGLTTGQLIERYRNNKYAKQLENLAIWNHMVIEDKVHQTFLDTLVCLYDSILEQRQDKLIALERIQGLESDQKKELWKISKALAKKKQ